VVKNMAALPTANVTEVKEVVPNTVDSSGSHAIDVDDDAYSGKPPTEIAAPASVDQSNNDKSVVDSEVGSKRDAAGLKELKPSPAKKQKQEDNDSDGDDKGSGKFQKRMMAIQFGYVGTGYAGLQK
jgi:hypothetical protein